MSDISDVLNTVAQTVYDTIYPNGETGAPSTGFPTYVYPGWPQSAQLNADMAVGRINVSVYQLPTEQNTTRYAPIQHVMSAVAPTLTLTMNASQTQITVAGSLPSPFSLCNVAVLIAGQAFLYSVQSTDTLNSIASSLAAAIAAQYPATAASGSVIALQPGIFSTAARVGMSAQVTTEWERQNAQIQIDVWAPTPASRAITGAAIKAALAQIAFLAMPDGFGARIQHLRSPFDDKAQNENIYRRTMIYTVEYATTTTQSLAEVIAINSTTEPSFSAGPGTPAPNMIRSY